MTAQTALLRVSAWSTAIHVTDDIRRPGRRGTNVLWNTPGTDCENAADGVLIALGWGRTGPWTPTIDNDAPTGDYSGDWTAPVEPITGLETTR
ncbi:hypothetical protein [Catenuloplanes japonicus]|uniref:hypothetical protein n=1 Tax=Catenuloplanes japonicus TaxID=33876 RepID=UPI0005270803|nr:hypothetical protein [Catenuloplanes japonicus]